MIDTVSVVFVLCGFMASVAICVSAARASTLALLIPDSVVRRQWRAMVYAIAGLASVMFLFLLLVLSEDRSLQLVVAAVVLMLVSGLFFLQNIILHRVVLAIRDVQSVGGVTVVDPLTGTHNRYYLEQRLDKEIARSQRYSAPLSVFAADIAGFQKFNDEYGHHAGDIAIKKVAAHLKNLLRETDIVGRYEADRFVLILPDTPESNSGLLESRLRAALCNVTVLDGQLADDSACVSVNFGQSHCQLSTLNGKQLISEAFQYLDVARKLDAMGAPGAIGKGQAAPAALTGIRSTATESA